MVKYCACGVEMDEIEKRCEECGKKNEMCTMCDNVRLSYESRCETCLEMCEGRCGFEGCNDVAVEDHRCHMHLFK